MMFSLINIITLLVDWDCTQKNRLEILAIINGGSVVFYVHVVNKFCYKYPSFVTVKSITLFRNAKEAN